MLIAFHEQARTTFHVRAQIAASGELYFDEVKNGMAKWRMEFGQEQE